MSLQKLLPMLLAGVLTACAAENPYENASAPVRQFDDAQAREKAVAQFAVDDPLGGVNRQTYALNAQIDRFVLLPLVDAYRFITPEVVRTRVSHFFSNVGEFHNFTNAVLQADAHKSTVTLGRFAVNSTAGVLGLFDVATDWGLPQHKEDFGQTLGVWGVGPGAYVVLPFFGPSNVRDTVGLVADYAMLAAVIPNHVEDATAYKAVFWGLQPVDARHSNGFRYYHTDTPFEYEFVRYGSARLRQLQVEK